MISSNSIILASTNTHKYQEFQKLFKHTDFNIKPLPNNLPQCEETGSTFIENAILKAKQACKLTQSPAIADDSGISVEALNGAPGIYSARYAGNKASDLENMNQLLDEMKHEQNRRAQYYCALVYLTHENDPTPLIACASWQGSLLYEPRGKHGFGYDPIFFIETLNQTASEIPIDQKNKISHRGLALQMLIKKMTSHTN